MIKIGITELHGIAQEVMANPPEGVRYLKVDNTPIWTNFFLRSSAIGVLDYFEGDDCDILEAPLFPIFTRKPWVYTPARFSGATSFNFLGIPIPKFIRVFLIKQLMLRDNFLGLVFKSEAGVETLKSYGRVKDKRIFEKVHVAYPCMREVEDQYIRYNTDKVNFTFSGDFFRKGGASVVDAFERLQQEYDNIALRVCTLPDMVRIKNDKLRVKYLNKLKANSNIEFGPVQRDVMLQEVLPETDVFVSPTFQEAFGFAILEASAYGIPVISTRHFAIPEIIEDGESGFLIPTAQFDYIRKGKKYILDDIPQDFHDYMTDQVYEHMKTLIEQPELRRTMGQKGLAIARTKFSFEERNKKMKQIYDEGLKRLAQKK